MATPYVAHVNLTAVAKYLLGLSPTGTVRSREEEVAYYATLDSWEALTGLTGPTALEYAQACSQRTTTAVVPPF